MMAKYKWPTQVPVLEAKHFRCGGGGKTGIEALCDGEFVTRNCLMEYANIVFCPPKVWDKTDSWNADTQIDEVPDEVYIALAEACGCKDPCDDGDLALEIINFNDDAPTMQQNADAWNKAMQTLGYTEIHEVEV
jgi:hypothetical protein